jgi:hypothetical protein
MDMSLEDRVRLIVECPEEIAHVASPTAFRVVDCLLTIEHPVQSIVSIISHSAVSDQLLYYFADGLKPVRGDGRKSHNKWLRAVDAVAAHANDNIERRAWSQKTVLEVLNDPQILGYLVDNYRGEITDPSHVLYHVNLDSYWNTRVRWFIAKGDLLRAWDELIKSVRGIAADHRVQSPHLHRISSKYLRPLVQSLFEALLAKGLVDPVTAGEHTIGWWQLYSACIGGTRTGRRRIQSPHMRGAEFKMLQIMGSPIEQLNREGVMVFRIGRHFRELRKRPRPEPRKNPGHRRRH